MPSPQKGDFCRPAVEAAALGPDGAPSEAAEGGRSGVTTVSSKVSCISRCQSGGKSAAVLGIRLDSPPQSKGCKVPSHTKWVAVAENAHSTFCVARICRARCCVIISASGATVLASADGAATAAGQAQTQSATAHSTATAGRRGQGRTMWCNRMLPQDVCRTFVGQIFFRALLVYAVAGTIPEMRFLLNMLFLQSLLHRLSGRR